MPLGVCLITALMESKGAETGAGCGDARSADREVMESEGLALLAEAVAQMLAN